MSYILDALRRADAERERGEVPGLQSQQHAMLDDDDAAPRSRPMVWVIVALVVALAAAIAWNFLGGEPPRSRPADVAAVVVPALPVVAVVASQAAPMPVTSPAVARPPSSPPVTAVARAGDTKRPLRREPLPAVAEPATGTKPENRIYAQAELPENIRRELPKLAIGGASYSGDPASRMIIVNGQVLHEGDKIASGLVLEKIKLKAAVLAYKGWRYQIDY